MSAAFRFDVVNALASPFSSAFDTTERRGHLHPEDSRMSVTNLEFFSICRTRNTGETILVGDGSVLDRAMSLECACRMASEFSDLTRGEVYQFDPESRTVRLVAVMATAPPPTFF